MQQKPIGLFPLRGSVAPWESNRQDQGIHQEQFVCTAAWPTGRV